MPTDFHDRLKKLSLEKGAEGSAPEQGLEVMSLNQALAKSFPDMSRRLAFKEGVLAPRISKLVRTQDIGSLRMASVSDRMEVKRNNMTPFMNFLESQEGGVATTLDFQYEFDEWDIGTDEPEEFDFQSALPGEAVSSRPVRSNTFSTIGNKLKFSDLSLDMADQQANIDLLAKEIDLQMTRMRRKMNSMLLSHTEVKTEGPVPIPGLGGFITRSTSNAIGLAGGDLTRAVLQSRIQAIANVGAQNGRGYNQLVVLTNDRQLQVVRDIMINEYNGIYPTDRLAFESALLAQVRANKVNVQVVFEALPGPPVPFIYEPQLPSGYTIIFEADKPRLVKYKLGGLMGPYVATRPSPDSFQRVEVVWDFFTLEDPIVESRVAISVVGT